MKTCALMCVVVLAAACCGEESAGALPGADARDTIDESDSTSDCLGTLVLGGDSILVTESGPQIIIDSKGLPFGSNVNAVVSVEATCGFSRVVEAITLEYLVINDVVESIEGPAVQLYPPLSFPVSVDSADPVEFSLVFKKIDGRQRVGSVSILTRAEGSTEASLWRIPLSVVSGTEVTPELVVVPHEVDFGTIRPGTTETQSVTLIAPLDGGVTVRWAALLDGGEGVFSMTSSLPSYEEDSYVSLLPGSEVRVSVKCYPEFVSYLTRDVNHSARLFFATNTNSGGQLVNVRVTNTSRCPRIDQIQISLLQYCETGRVVALALSDSSDPGIGHYTWYFAETPGGCLPDATDFSGPPYFSFAPCGLGKYEIGVDGWSAAEVKSCEPGYAVYYHRDGLCGE